MTVGHLIALDDFGGLQTLFLSFAAYASEEGQPPLIINRAKQPPLDIFQTELGRNGVESFSPQLKYAAGLAKAVGNISLGKLPGRIESLEFRRSLEQIARRERLKGLVSWNGLPWKALVPKNGWLTVYDHGLSSIQRPTRRNRMRMRLSSQIICVSRANEALLREHWGWDGEIHRLMNPLRSAIADTPMRDYPKALADGPIIVGVASRLMAFKGIASVVHAIKHVRDKGYDVKLQIAGEGPELENLQTTTDKLELSEHVEFRGLVSDMGEFLNGVHVFVAASIREPFGLSPLEALALSIPTVVSAVDGHGDILPFPEAASMIEPTLSLGEYAKLGSSLNRMPEFVYSPTKGHLMLPRAIDPEAIAVELGDIIDNYEVAAERAWKAAVAVRDRNSMDAYMNSFKRLVAGFGAAV